MCEEKSMKKPVVITLFLFAAHFLFGGVSYTVYSDFTVKDNSTGLIWTRCSLAYGGNAKTSPGCSGTISGYGWEEALQACNDLEFAGRTDWRLPSIRELQSIVYYHEYLTPSVNNTVFPSTVSDHYWSSTYHKNNSNLVWTLDFQYGNVTFQLKEDSGILTKNYVRCVTGPDN
jgi:hypothetical protein